MITTRFYFIILISMVHLFQEKNEIPIGSPCKIAGTGHTLLKEKRVHGLSTIDTTTTFFYFLFTLTIKGRQLL
jgi:hypothetical protein